MSSIDIDRVQAVVLDVGNVVLAIDFAKSIAVWSERSGVPADEIAARFSMDDNYCAHERGEITAPEFHRELCARLGAPLSWPDFVEGWLALLVEPMPRIDDVLAALAARWPVAYFSNTNELHRLCFFRRFRATMAPFTNGFASSQLGARKPEAESFALVAAKLGVEPGAIAFFDDTESNVVGAREAQWQAMLTTNPLEIADCLGLDLD